MSGGDVLLLSDVHTRYRVIERQTEHAEGAGESVERIVVLGDFGFFGDELRDCFRRDGFRFRRPVATLDGNHEDHGALPDLVRAYDDVVTYLPRGGLHRLGPWSALCLGGARYMDAASTPRGSEVTAADLAVALGHPHAAVDVVLSHDCPAGIGVPNARGLEHYGPPGVPEFRDVAARYRPRIWFFGHHHRWFDEMVEGTRFLGLPQSWDGYVRLTVDGEVEMVEHAVPQGRPSWWRRWLEAGFRASPSPGPPHRR